MAQLTNSPQQPTLLRLERSKSFSMGLRIYKEINGQRQPLDITGSSLQFVMSEPPHLGGRVVISQALEMLSPNVGYSRLNLQASSLALTADEGYHYIFRLLDAGGYSRVLLRGEVEIIDNPDAFASNTYEEFTNLQGLAAVLRGDQVVNISLEGGVGVPGADGLDGPPNTLTIGAVTTLPPGTPAEVTIDGDAPVQELSFGIPTAEPVPALDLTFGTPVTGDAGTEVELEVTGAYPSKELTFTVPRGVPGIATVVHAGDADVERPAAAVVHWVGHVVPNNAIVDDFWSKVVVP